MSTSRVDGRPKKCFGSLTIMDNKASIIIKQTKEIEIRRKPANPAKEIELNTSRDITRHMLIPWWQIRKSGRAHNCGHPEETKEIQITRRPASPSFYVRNSAVVDTHTLCTPDVFAINLNLHPKRLNWTLLLTCLHCQMNAARRPRTAVTVRDTTRLEVDACILHASASSLVRTWERTLLLSPGCPRHRRHKETVRDDEVCEVSAGSIIIDSISLVVENLNL